MRNTTLNLDNLFEFPCEFCKQIPSKLGRLCTEPPWVSRRTVGCRHSARFCTSRTSQKMPLGEKVEESGKIKHSISPPLSLSLSLRFRPEGLALDI